MDPAARGLGLASARQLQGKELSYNNLVDLEAAWRLVREFEEPTTAIIKHTNPCGIASAETLAESYRRAVNVDPVSAYGSVIALNRPIDGETAEAMSRLFIEAVVAPGYDPAALERLAGKKNLRLIDLNLTQGDVEGPQIKVIGGGLLVQSPDTLATRIEDWKCVTTRQPSRARCETWPSHGVW